MRRHELRCGYSLLVLVAIMALTAATCAAEQERKSKSDKEPFTNRGIEGIAFVPIGGLTSVQFQVSLFSTVVGKNVNFNADYLVSVNGALAERIAVDRSVFGIDCSETCGGCPDVSPTCGGCGFCGPTLTIRTQPLELAPNDRVTIEIFPARGGVPELFPLDDIKAADCCSCPVLLSPEARRGLQCVGAPTGSEALGRN